jgi:hypothetical protein
MPTDLTALDVARQQTLVSAVFNSETVIPRIATLHVEPSKNIEIQDVDGLAKFTQQAGATDITPTFARAFKSRSNPVVLEALTQLTNKEARDIRAGAGFDINELYGRMFGANMLRKMAADVFALLAGVRATAHPENGVSGSPLAAVGGGTLYCADNITTTPINTPGSPFNQTNDFNLAFNSANVDTILAYRPRWKSRDGDNNADPNTKPVCVTPSALTKRARTLFGRTNEIYDGTGLQTAHAGEVSDIVEDTSGSLASDAFLFLYKAMKFNPAAGSMVEMFPVHLHINLLPNMKLVEAPAGNYTNLVAEIEYDVFFDTMVDRDVIYSQP